jgi:hypothetical protein
VVHEELFKEGLGKSKKESALFSFADVTTFIFGKDQKAMTHAATIHKLLLSTVLEEDKLKKVSYSEWLWELEIVRAPC